MREESFDSIECRTPFIAAFGRIGGVLYQHKPDDLRGDDCGDNRGGEGG